MRLFAPLQKAETLDADGALRIRGVASAETVDAAGEIVTAAAMKAALPDFMRLGSGALREMHQLSAAGTVDEAEVKKSGETVIVATVVDKAAIEKVKKGVYKGFSIGGRVMKRDPKDKNIITALKLTEISLVDSPANPDSVLLWKSDGQAPGVSRETIQREVAAALAALPADERALVLLRVRPITSR